MESAAKLLLILFVLASIYVCLRVDGKKGGREGADESAGRPEEKEAPAGESGGPVSCGPVKSLLMPLLIAFFLTALASPLRFEILGKAASEPYFPESHTWLLVVLGLAFGCAGDTLLEIAESGKFFTCGLGAFLLGHLFYIWAAVSQIDGSMFQPASLIGLVAYGILLAVEIRMILPDVPKDMKGAVVAYMTVLLGMSISMYLRAGSVPASAFLCGLAGSLLFILSDTLLAVHVFSGKAFRGVMETYSAAQLLITAGFLLSM